MAINFLGIGDSIAGGYYGFTPEYDGGPSGNIESQIWYQLAILLGNVTYYNSGHSAERSDETLQRISQQIIAHQPENIYLHTGNNDLSQNFPISNLLNSLTMILGVCKTNNANLIVNQLNPWSRNPTYNGTLAEFISERKRWNSFIEEWCFFNKCKLTPNWQELCDTNVSNEDKLLGTYDGGDQVHPSVAGYTKLGQLYFNADIPNKFRYWGHNNFPTFGYESIKWFLLSEGATFSGDNDKGTILLPSTTTADSVVMAIIPNQKITITPTLLSGSVNIYYRISTLNFIRNSEASWTSYSAPVDIGENCFVQIRLEANTDSEIDYLKLSWKYNNPNNKKILKVF